MFKLGPLLVVFLAIHIGVDALISEVSNATLVEKALDEVGRLAIDALAQYAKTGPIPDQSDDSGDLRYRITNIQVKDFTKPSSKISLTSGNRLSWTATNAAIDLHCNWWARYKTWLLSVTKSGSLDASATGVSFSVTAALERDSSGKPSLRPAGCTSSVSDVDLDFHGGALVSLLSALFEPLAEAKVEDLIPGKMCDALRAGITSIASNSNAQPYLTTLYAIVGI